MLEEWRSGLKVMRVLMWQHWLKSHPQVSKRKSWVLTSVVPSVLGLGEPSRDLLPMHQSLAGPEESHVE